MYVYEDFVCTFILLIVLGMSRCGLVVFTYGCTVPLFEVEGSTLEIAFIFSAQTVLQRLFCYIPGHLRWSRTPAQYLQVRVGGYSSSWEAFQVDVEARTSNTAVLFAGVYLTVGSLRDPSRKSISTNCTMSKASQLL